MKSRNNEKGVGGRLQQLWVKTARTVPKRGMPERRCSGTRRQELLISQQIDVGLRLATSARHTPLFMALLSGLSPNTCLFMARRCINSSLAWLNTSRASHSVFAPASLWFQACSCSDHATTSRTGSTGGRQAGHDAGRRQLRQCGARVKWIVFVCEQCGNGFSARQFATDVKAQQSRAHGRCRGSG